MGRKHRGTPKGQRNWFEWIRASIRSLGMMISMGVSALAAVVDQKSQWLQNSVNQFPGGKVGVLIALIIGAGVIVKLVEDRREKNSDNSEAPKPAEKTEIKEEVK